MTAINTFVTEHHDQYLHARKIHDRGDSHHFTFWTCCKIKLKFKLMSYFNDIFNTNMCVCIEHICIRKFIVKY